jgi:hypothetical protein
MTNSIPARLVPTYSFAVPYLHRDGRLSSPVKGNHFKGPFYLPRMQWYCWQLLEDWEAESIWADKQTS